MLAGRSSAGGWILLVVSYLYTVVLISEGHAEYITVRRQEKRSSDPIVVNVDNSPVDREDFNAFDQIHNERNSRIKRDVRRDPVVGSPVVNVSHLNDSHQQVMIQWAGDGSPVIICLMRNAVQNTSVQSTMFISKDYGSTYENISNKFEMSDGKLAIISTFYNNKVFHSRFVFTDVLNKYIFVTKDHGETIVPYKVEFIPSEVMFHPLDAEVLLIHDTEDPERKLWISEDFGDTWTKIVYVKSFFMSEFTSPPTLYIERRETEFSAVLASQDLFREGSTPTIVIESILEFEVKDEFLFAAKKSGFLEDTLSLHISYRGGRFHKAMFPNDMKHEQYHIEDVSEGQVMVCVAHGGFLSNLYMSSVPRSPNHPVKFSLSLERILFFKPSPAWENTWLSEVADKPFADLHQVQGIRGVFIASQLMDNMTSSSDSTRLHQIGPEHTVSYISFDQGAQWKPLQPPRRYVNGTLIDCKKDNGCSLHVGQSLSYYYPRTEMTPVVSKKSAPGLILATGTIGPSLKGHTSLYVSVDAGMIWYQVLQGNFRYAFGDHGGILVAVQHYRTAGEIDTLYYSTDDGESWNTYKFSNESLRIYGLLTEPGENTTIFTLFGSRPGKHQWMFIKVDLRPVFQYNCSAGDYRKWSPSDGRRGRLCLLGRKQEYERRIPHYNCYSGVGYDRPVSTENCPCDRDDYECDFGFVIDGITQKCVKDLSDIVDPFAIPSTCIEGGFYNRTKGYRLIPGDTCQGGRDHLYNPTLTACPLAKEREFLLVSARQEILRFDLLNPDAGLQPLPVPNLHMVIALDFDLANNCIFWSDVNTKKILRLCFDGSHDVETLVETNLRSVEGLAFDWVSKNLYFVDGERKTLEVIRTDISNFGRMRRTLLGNDTLDTPRGIALHPIKGFLYLTDWSESSPKVARAYLDGQNFTTLFGEGEVGWPNGITIDFQEDRIFFADAKLDYIASADLNGHDMRKIITDNPKVSQPFAVGIYKSTIYWDDWTVKQVMQADKKLGVGISPISNLTRNGLVDLKVYGYSSQQGSNACVNQSENCKFLCMGRPNNEFSCLCPDGLKRASVPSGSHEECWCPDGSPVDSSGACKSVNSTCAPGFFRCNNNKCIPEPWVCDNDNDCGDGSDENSPKCGTLPCYSPYWQCRSGQCIAPSYRCDHHPDCDDNSDEENCRYATCVSDAFQCANGKCIHLQWKCDLEDDCRDGSDEVNCTAKPEAECKSTEFKCQNKQCIPSSWRCDGQSDCSDSSDENDCQTFSCFAWQFACNSGIKKCIFRTWKCDGEKDCDDGSDEVNCATPTTTTPAPTTEEQCSDDMFICDNGNCIPFLWRCDLLDDCGDASDEDGCSNHGFPSGRTTQELETTTIAHRCLRDQFQCATGECIWETSVCDVIHDCINGEDEMNCPEVKTCAALSEYKCRRSSGCIPSKLICDGHADCADGSDEEGCSTNTTPSIPCPAGYFTCDGGTCLPLFKRCDNFHDCIDMSDEQNCTTSDNDNKVYAVTRYNVSSTNVSLTVEWQVNSRVSPPANLEYLLSYTKKTTPGNHNVWNNMTWTTNTSYEVHNLSPYTSYVLKVYIREKNGTKIFSPIHSKDVRTRQGIPSPPRDVKLEREFGIIKVTWKPPSRPNGVIKKYHIFGEPRLPREPVLSGNNLEAIIPRSLISHNTSIWVTAENDDYRSQRSNLVQFHTRNVDHELKVKVANVSSSSVNLTWDAVKGVDGYIVGHDRPENIYLTGNITTNTSKTSIQLSGLAPGLEYTFWVISFEGRILGHEKKIKVNTLGKKLLPVKSLHAVVTQEGRTVKLSWTEPSYKTQKVLWIYRIIWGKSASDLKNGAHFATTPNTTFTIRGLDACETYHVAVMVLKPIGIGPVAEKQIHTGSDAKAPPNNLQARLENMTMMITWQVSCPQAGVENRQYMLFITETNQNVTSAYQLLSRNNHTQGHYVEVDWGGRYSIQVRRAVEDAVFTPTVICNGPQIPPPFELIYNYINSSFFWRNSPNLPKEISSKNYTYVLHISKHVNMTDATAHECIKPPLVVNNLDNGINYYVAVALKNANGYLSLWSQTLSIDRPIDDELVISKGSALGVGLSVFFVLVALLVVLVVLFVRHRRLARSIITFTNTHYDSSQGTTLITTDHNLDEDDDSPMIRGFSDDEPLVIA